MRRRRGRPLGPEDLSAIAFATGHGWPYGRCSECGAMGVMAMGYSTFHPLCAPVTFKFEEQP